MVFTIVLLALLVAFGVFIARQLVEQRRHGDAPPDRMSDGATERGRGEVQSWQNQRHDGQL